MKGVVFTEFMEMVESRMGLDVLDRIITEAALPNDGAYTSIGTYDHAELVRLVTALSNATGLSTQQLIFIFGEQLFQRFSVGYSALFNNVRNAFDFLSRIDGVIHVEVRKLYPDAELPKLECERPSTNELTILYSSPRGFGDLAAGLIAGCIKHFDEPISVTRTDLEKLDTCHRVRFDLVRG
ncbi:HNOB domain-containing protein [Candidatus Nitrotoga sp. HW29]|uniref:heme NO-binding domain-containing protein n=1 Tax=Candidatus Nitrotoga sp. HW29 TaxID=2886963 RepID=UPI001EF39948|nr:heme NO-binding domain-containing protein [Candidatus Nitrotoga sp. HW29]CAH1904562.1 HNOB domain-containing protein [Candidatus Nitrotoga sp. HW29]